MRLTEWARQEGIHPKTAYKWYREGNLPVPARVIGVRTIVVDVPAKPDGPAAALYARVSSHDQKADLDGQVARLAVWSAGQGLPVTQMVTEVGSGRNGKRAKLGKLLSDRNVTMIVVEHRDRLGRMNTELVEAALAASGRHLLVVNTGEVDDNLVRGVTEVMVSFCARLYGKRSAKNRAAKASACAAGTNEPSSLPTVQGEV